jgi:hypothetical protein
MAWQFYAQGTPAQIVAAAAAITAGNPIPLEINQVARAIADITAEANAYPANQQLVANCSGAVFAQGMGASPGVQNTSVGFSRLSISIQPFVPLANGTVAYVND